MPRHHIVPQTYLRNFADKRDQVMLVDRDDPTRAHLNAVRKACAEVGFYRIETEALGRAEDRAAHDPEGIERHLGNFENTAAPVLRNIIETESLAMTMKDWFDLINFVALQSVRGRRFREDFEALATQAMRQRLHTSVSPDQVRQWLIKDGKPHGPAEVTAFRREMAGERGPRLRAPQAVLVQEAFKQALGPVGEAHAGRAPYLLRSRDVPVLTSDEPVCWWAPDGQPVGFGTAQVVWMPLSRSLVLELRGPEYRHLGLPGTDADGYSDQLVGFVNEQVAGQAHKWVVHHPEDRPLDAMQMPPRTAWRNVLVDTKLEGSTIRERYIFRRVPVGSTADPAT